MARTERLYQPPDGRRQRLRQGPLRLLRRQGRAGQGQGRPRADHGRAPGRKTSRSPRPPVEQAESQVESIKINARPADRPRPGRRRGPPGQRPARPVRRDGLERADDRPGRRQAAARPGRHRRERPALCSTASAEAVATLKGRPAGPVPAQVRQRRALRDPQEEPHRRQLRAGRHPGPPGHLRAARRPRRSTSTSASRWTSTSRPSRPSAAASSSSAGATASSPSRRSREPRRREAGRLSRRPSTSGSIADRQARRRSSFRRRAFGFLAAGFFVRGSSGGTTLNFTTCRLGGAPLSSSSWRMMVSSYSPGSRPFSEIVFRM